MARADLDPPEESGSEDVMEGEGVMMDGEDVVDAERVDELIAELDEMVGIGERALDWPAGPGAGAPTGASPFGEGPEADGDADTDPSELRRGLEVLDEVVALRPDDLSLRARRIRYLERLGAERRRLHGERDLAERLADGGNLRAAGLLCRFILSRRPGDDPATREILSSLHRFDDRGVLLPRSVRRGSPNGSRPSPGRRLRDSLEAEMAIHAEALPWLYRADRQSKAPGDPPVDAYRDYARYLVIRGRADEACELLLSVLDRGIRSDESEHAVRADLVEALLEGDRRMEAVQHLQVLASQDEAFGVVLGTVARR